MFSSLEVQLVGLDLRAVVDHEAELAEDPRDLALGLAHRMQRAAPQRAAGQRDVHRLRRQAHLQRDRLEAASPRGDGRLELLADGVGHGADARPVLRGQRADAAEQRAQLTLAAEVGASTSSRSSGGVAACATAATARSRSPVSLAEKD